MIIVFESIDDLNSHYANVLSELDKINRNVSPPVAEKMLKNLMKEYDTNLKLLRKNEKFQMKILNKKEKMYQKNTMLDTKFDCKKMKYTITRKWWMNFKFFREYKKKCKLEMEKQLAQDKKEIIEFKSVLKAFYDDIKNLKTKRLEPPKEQQTNKEKI